jgi:UDP-glucuronate decarboxylase
MNKRILVTGGSGFLGSHLCERLLTEGHRVICVDNLSTGAERNIAHLINNSNFKFIHHDITLPLSFEVDEIYNLACPATFIYYKLYPAQTMKTLVLGAINMLDLAKRSNAKILQASTSEVYGDPQLHPQPESYRGNVNPIGPRACYDEGKRCAEALFFDYRRLYDLNIKVVRIFNTYGPRMRSNNGPVISNFIMQALKNEDITVYGEGKQTRSFCFVDDLIEGMIRMMNSCKEFTGPVNIGNPDEITISELALKVINFTDTHSKIVYRPLPEDDPIRRKPNIDLTKKELGWHPTIKLDDGLRSTIKYFEELLSV